MGHGSCGSGYAATRLRGSAATWLRGCVTRESTLSLFHLHGLCGYGEVHMVRYTWCRRVGARFVRQTRGKHAGRVHASTGKGGTHKGTPVVPQQHDGLQGRLVRLPIIPSNQATGDTKIECQCGFFSLISLGSPRVRCNPHAGPPYVRRATRNRATRHQPFIERPTPLNHAIGARQFIASIRSSCVCGPSVKVDGLTKSSGFPTGASFDGSFACLVAVRGCAVRVQA